MPAGLRPRVSTVTMESRGESVYTAVIVPRRGAPPRSAPARERFLVFAVSDAGVDVAWHGLRWGIESWYRELESARIRTRSENPAGRAICLAYSLIMLNAWVMAMALAGLASRGARMTHAGFCDTAADLADRGLILPEPPPEPP